MPGHDDPALTSSFTLRPYRAEDEDAAIADAKTRIDYLNQRSVIVEYKRQASHA